MRPGRYNTDGILTRLEAKGFIYESDLAWLEKRARRLGLDAQDAGEPAGEEHEKICAAFKELFNKCTGEAHSNAFIDHCGMCMPRWGRVINRDKVLRNLQADEIQLLGELVAANGMPIVLRQAERRAARHLCNEGLARVEWGDHDDQITITDAGRTELTRRAKAVS